MSSVGVEWEVWEQHIQRPWGRNKLDLFKGLKQAKVTEHGGW